MSEFPGQSRLDEIVRRRIETAREEIETSIAHIANGNPLASEPNKERRLARLQTKASLTRSEAAMVSMGIDAASQAEVARPVAEALKTPGAEAILGPTLDFVGVAFLERGRRAADAVARVAFLNGRPQGSGFMVAPRLFLTNHHVIASAAAAIQFCVEFDYEQDLLNRARPITRFALDPSLCFVTDGIEGLDYTLIGVGERLLGPREDEEFGFIPISDASDKHMLGETANIVQHPQGRYKEVVLRENRLVSRDETVQVLHYIADTEAGSSGSPVFNNEWEPIALHHWAGPFRELTSPAGLPLAREINEGIRISAIVKDLRRRAAGASEPSVSALRKSLRLWHSSPRGGVESVRRRDADLRKGASARQNPDGSISWTFPIEINVRAPLLDPTAVAAREPQAQAMAAMAASDAAAEAARWTTEDFSDRGGYEPGFIPGFIAPLPTVANSSHRPAVNQDAAPGDDPHELRYHHFSIVMNADRRLAFFTACNIDGSRIKAVERRTKTVIDNPTLADLGVESFGLEGAEASDDFRPDRRILPEEQMNRPFYETQKVPGFPEPTDPRRIARMFQKGHIIMRGDPAWGSDGEALSAERDTFFYTNAAPQVGFFNQGSPFNRPGMKGKLRWRAVETYILRNAVAMRQRVTVFAGPIFADDDPPYRFDALVPMRFWKIAVWAEEADLRAIGLIADQSALIKVMPEAMILRPEAFTDDPELARVSEFISTVSEIEALTGLDFGDAIRAADVRIGLESQRAAQDLTADDLRPGRRRPVKRRPDKTMAARRKRR